MRIREPQTLTASDIGSAVVSNRDTRRRRVMQSLTIPLTEADNYQLGQPVTVLNPGTGRNERCQVEGWVKPYDGGTKERVVRLTFPAVLEGSDLRRSFEFRHSAAGILPTYTPRQHVLDRLQELQIQWFCGPKVSPPFHYVVVKTADDPLPSPIYEGTRSKLYRWFTRLYQPAHTPALETQFWVEFDIEVLHDEDVALFWWRWGVDDPRIDEPNGWRRNGHVDFDTEIGFDFIPAGANQNGVRPVVFFPSSYCVTPPNFVPGYAWQFIQDKRFIGQLGFSLNECLPWGIMGQGSGVLCFPGLTGTHNDQLRDDSIAAWISTPYPVKGISEDWNDKQEAFGPVGRLPRPLKLHEHQNRLTFAQWQTQIASDSWSAAQASTFGMTWFPYDGEGALLWQSHTSNATGAHGSWNKVPCAVGCTYAVPEYGLYCERAMGLNPWPQFFREADGSLFTALNHPDTVAVRMVPGQLNGQGDLHGKTSQPIWNSSPNGLSGNLIHARVTSGSPPQHSPFSPNDPAHYENGWQAMVPVVFGDRGLMRQAEAIARGMHWATLPVDGPRNPGQSGEPRGWMRGMTMWSWFTYAFGRDTAFLDWAQELYDYYYAVSKGTTDLQFPGRVFESTNVFPPDLNRPVNKVGLWTHDYWRPWEDGIGVLGFYGLGRMLGTYNATLRDECYRIAKGIARDTIYLASPRVIDQNGRLEWTYYRPHGFITQGGQTVRSARTIYEPAAAVGVTAGGTRRLEQVEFNDNNWERCPEPPAPPTCGSEGLGWMFLGVPSSSTASFTHSADSYIADMLGAVDDVFLTRYCREDQYGGVITVQSGQSRQTDILQSQRWAGGAHENIVLGRITTRATTIPNTSGAAVSGIAPDDLWITAEPLGNAILRVSRQSGGTGVSFTPASEPLGSSWTDCTTLRRSAQDVLALLDGRDPDLNRTSYRIYVTTEQAPASQQAFVSFTFPDATPRECRALAHDPHADQWVVLAWRQGFTTAWRVPYAGGVATADTRIVLGREVDADPWSLDIMRDGRLMVMGAGSGRVLTYAWASGGYWGSPRTQGDRDRVACFTKHGRQDDALRLVTVSASGVIRETEV